VRVGAQRRGAWRSGMAANSARHRIAQLATQRTALRATCLDMNNVLRGKTYALHAISSLAAQLRRT